IAALLLATGTANGIEGWSKAPDAERGSQGWFKPPSEKEREEYRKRGLYYPTPLPLRRLDKVPYREFHQTYPSLPPGPELNGFEIEDLTRRFEKPRPDPNAPAPDMESD